MFKRSRSALTPLALKTIKALREELPPLGHLEPSHNDPRLCRECYVASRRNCPQGKYYLEELRLSKKVRAALDTIEELGAKHSELAQSALEAAQQVQALLAAATALGHAEAELVKYQHLAASELGLATSMPYGYGYGYQAKVSTDPRVASAAEAVCDLKVLLAQRTEELDATVTGFVSVDAAKQYLALSIEPRRSLGSALASESATLGCDLSDQALAIHRTCDELTRAAY